MQIMAFISFVSALVLCEIQGQQFTSTDPQLQSSPLNERQRVQAALGNIFSSHSLAQLRESAGSSSSKNKAASLEAFLGLIAAFKESIAFNHFFTGRAARVLARRPTLAVLQNEKMMDVSRRTKHGFLQLSGAGEDSVIDRIKNRIPRITKLVENKEIENVIIESDFVLHYDATGSGKQIDFDSFIVRLNSCLEILTRRYNGQLDTEDELVQRVLWTKGNLTQCSENGCAIQEENTSADMESLSAAEVNRNISKLNMELREDGSVDWVQTFAANRTHFSLEFVNSLTGNHGKATGQNENETLEVQHLRKVADSYKESVELLKNEEETRKGQEIRDGYLGESTQDGLAKLRQIRYKIDEQSKLATLSRLNLHMQLISENLERELEEFGANRVADLPELRLFVAEANLIEESLVNVMKPVDEALQRFSKDEVATYLVDENKLQLISSRVDDLRGRLGVKGTSLAIDWGTAGTQARQLGTKIREGLDAGSMVMRILWSDLRCTLKLISKAAFGYRLKPFQVNTVRRFFKDVLVLLPNIIILIIPLSPVGHVLIFTFIKEKVPWLLPSCLSEKRIYLQRLLQGVSDGKNKMLMPRADSSWSSRIKRFWELLPVHILGGAYKKLGQWLKLQLRKPLENPPTAQPVDSPREAKLVQVTQTTTSHTQNLTKSQQDLSPR